MRLRFSEIGHWIGWCPKKRSSQIILGQDCTGITTTGGFTMDAKKDEIGRYLPLTFPKRMFIFILALLVVMNIGVFYFHEKTSFGTVLGATIFEIVYLGIFFAFWIPRYDRADARVKW
ncbi:hypothetical protein [Methanoregula sp.]|uniref:hypothetical protein n=1 Tax=Methanoregula sp. TaxID=2052170 RepID=UPI003BAE55CE